MTTLLQHLETLNAEKQAWMDTNPGSWTGLYTTDMDHWADQGIFTVEDFERDSLIGLIWDAFKDVYGYRPRGTYNFDTMSLAELQSEADRLCDAANAQYEIEQEEAARAVEEFKSIVVRTIELGAGDEETALRWLTQDETFYHSQDVEHWVYNQGILFTDYGRELTKRLETIVEYKQIEEAA